MSGILLSQPSRARADAPPRTPLSGLGACLVLALLVLVVAGSLPSAYRPPGPAAPPGGGVSPAVTASGGGTTGLSPDWRPLTTTNAPPARMTYGPVMAYDARDGYTLLYGGLALPAGVFYDTWAYANGTWRNFTPTLGPKLLDPAMAYDPTDGYVVLVGGAGPNCPTQCTEAFTWTFQGGVWTQLNTTGPSPRVYASLAWDPTLDELVLFGGSGRLGAMGDTWTFLHGDWKQLTVPGPPARSCAAMTYVPAAGGLILFGGLSGPVGATFASDTWRFDGTWTQVFASGPSARACTEMVAEPTAGDGILFGGMGNTPAGSWIRGDLGDTWSFDGSSWTNLQMPGPSARFGSFLTYDVADGYVLLVDGGSCKANCTIYSTQHDAWTFSLGRLAPQVSVRVSPENLCIVNEASCPVNAIEARVNLTVLIGSGAGPDSAPAIVAPDLRVLPWGSVRIVDPNSSVESCLSRGSTPAACSFGSTPWTTAGADGFNLNLSAIAAQPNLYVGDVWSIQFAVNVVAPPYGSVPVYACTTPQCLSQGSGTLQGALSALEFQPQGPGSTRNLSLPFANVTIVPPQSPSSPSTTPPAASPPPPPPVPTGVPSPVVVPNPVPVVNPVGVISLVGIPTLSLTSVGAGVLGAGFARAFVHRRAIAMGQPVGTVVAPRRSAFERAERSAPSEREFD